MPCSAGPVSGAFLSSVLTGLNPTLPVCRQAWPVLSCSPPPPSSLHCSGKDISRRPLGFQESQLFLAPGLDPYPGSGPTVSLSPQGLARAPAAGESSTEGRRGGDRWKEGRMGLRVGLSRGALAWPSGGPGFYPQHYEQTKPRNLLVKELPLTSVPFLSRSRRPWFTTRSHGALSPSLAHGSFHARIS